MNEDSTITIDYIKPLRSGKVRVKVKEHHNEIAGFVYKGKKYTTIKRLNRGRYIMTETNHLDPNPDLVEIKRGS